MSEAAFTDRIDPHVWRIATVVVLGSIMSILDTTIVNVALDTLGRDLHSPLASIQWVLTGYMLALAAVIPVTGWAARRFGAGNVYLISLVLFTAGSALCGFATSTDQLIVFRILQGIGGGMLLPIGQMMLAGAAGPKRMGRVMSVVAIPAMLAPIFGPTIGGLIVDNLSWRWIFFVNIPIGIAAFIAAWRMLPRGTRSPAEKLDVPGFLLLASGVPLLTYGLAEIGATGQIATPRVLVPLILGIILIGVFALYALRVPRPLLDLHLYRRATFASASVAMFCLGAALFGGMVLLPLYWQQVRFESVLDTGLLTAPMGLGMAAIMPIAGRLTDRYGGGPMALIGVIVTTLATIPFAMIGAHTSILALSLVERRSRDGCRLRLHAGDDGRVRRAQALRAVRRGAAAEHRPAGRRLDRHRRARRRARARAARRAHAPAGGRGLRHGVLVVGGDHRGRDRALHRPHVRRARGAARRRPRSDPVVGAAGGERRMTTAAPPAPARDEAVTRLGASFKRAMVAVRRLRGRETHRPGSPSFAQYQLLFALDDRDDLSAGELATAADLSPATVSHMLDSLVELGFVTRDRSTHDRRVVTCSLTAEGRKLIAQRRALFEGRWARRPRRCGHRRPRGRRRGLRPHRGDVRRLRRRGLRPTRRAGAGRR